MSLTSSQKFGSKILYQICQKIRPKIVKKARRTQNTSHITQSQCPYLYRQFSLKLVPENVTNIVPKVYPNFCTKFVKKSVPKLLKKQEEHRTLLT